MSQTEAVCLIPSVSSDPRRRSRATDEMRSQQLHPGFSEGFAVPSVGETRAQIRRKSCTTHKVLNNPHEIKMNFCSPVLTKGRSVGVHFLVTHRHAASSRGPEWRHPGAVTKHALVCSTCRWAQREIETPDS